MKHQSDKALTDREPIRVGGLIVGAAIYSLGVNLFVVPANLYAGGVMGMCQIIRTVMTRYLHLNFGTLDIAGILYYIVNLPILLIAWRKIDRRFVFKTVCAVTSVTLCMSFIPIVDIMPGSDPLTKCLLGGLTTGIGCGIVLYMGGTSGGMDVVGIILMKQGSRISVGQVNLTANVILYTACALLFQLPTALYSIIYAMVLAVTVDRFHSQNINVEVNIITKINTHDMEQDILNKLHRGVTKLHAEGEYTEEPVTMLYVLVSKYEINHLRRIIDRHDPHAFVVAKPNAVIYGNYLKKL